MFVIMWLFLGFTIVIGLSESIQDGCKAQVPNDYYNSTRLDPLASGSTTGVGTLQNSVLRMNRLDTPSISVIVFQPKL